MINLKKVAIAATLMSLSAAVFANEAQAPVSQSNFYVGVNAGFSKAILGNEYFAVSSSDSPFTLAGHAGYQFNNYIAAEAGLGYIFSKDDNNQSAHMYYPYAAAKLMLPVANARGNIYAKLGVADIRAKDNDANKTDSKFGAYIGIGGEYKVTQNIGVNLDMSGPMTTNDGLTLYIPAYTLGLSYSF